MIKKKIVFGIFICCFFWLQSVYADVPQRPNPPRLVNDLAQIFTQQQQQQLEHLLIAFNDSTSNQIVVLTLSDLGGYDKMQLAYEIGQHWGVGQKELNNGIVILIKPKNATQGQAAIATGYGLEGVLPDAVCKQIVDNEMIPFFREGNYYGGVLQALSIIMPIVSGEYSYKQYGNQNVNGTVLLVFLGIFIVIIVLLVITGKGKRKNGGNGGNISGTDPLTMFWLGSMVGHGSSGGFGSRGGGGFGGFGGGSFGGGGAGGSW